MLTAKYLKESESSSDEDFLPYDSEEEAELDKIDEEEIRLTNKEAKEPILTPLRKRVSIMRN